MKASALSVSDGSCATEAREPSQGREAAALSESYGAPQTACLGAGSGRCFAILACLGAKGFVRLWRHPGHSSFWTLAVNLA